MPLKKQNLLGMRQGLAHQAAVALARGQVVALDVRGVDLRPASVGFDHGRNLPCGTKDNPPRDLHDVAVFAALIHRRVQQVIVQDAPWRFARTTRAALGWLGLRLTVVGHQGRDIRRQFIAGEERRVTIRPRLEFGQKCACFAFAALVADVAHHTQMTGQPDRSPDPHVPDGVRIVWQEVFLLFLTKVHCSSIWACEICRS